MGGGGEGGEVTIDNINVTWKQAFSQETTSVSGRNFLFILFFLFPRLKSCVSPLPQCALELSQHSTFLYSQELDSFSNICLRALDGSSYEVRCAVAHLLGSLLSLTQKPLPPAMRGKLKLPSLEEALTILSNGFVRGGSGFLKAGGPELLKGGVASRETRVGVTQVHTKVAYV